MHYSLYYMDTPTTYNSLTHVKYQNLISWTFFFALTLVHEQLAIARWHGATDVSEPGTPN